MTKYDSRLIHCQTGDEASMDAEGYVAITGRIKDLIIKGGENIHPLEIENCLLAHPGVSEVSAVGLPDERYGEVVAAFVVPRLSKDSTAVTIEEVRQWVREKLSHHLGESIIFWPDPIHDHILLDIPAPLTALHNNPFSRRLFQPIYRLVRWHFSLLLLESLPNHYSRSSVRLQVHISHFCPLVPQRVAFCRPNTARDRFHSHTRNCALMPHNATKASKHTATWTTTIHYSI